MLHRLPITAHSAARRFATSSSAAAMAHVTRVTAGNQAAFDAAIKEHAGQEDVKVVALFTGASDASGVSWCPDCNDAKPAIEAALAKADGPTVFITVPLVRDEYKGNASHWARCVAAERIACDSIVGVPALSAAAECEPLRRDRRVRQNATRGASLHALVARRTIVSCVTRGRRSLPSACPAVS